MPITGHFASLSEARKLVRDELLAGVVQETYEEGQLLKVLPVTTIDSRSLIYNRESVLPSAAFYDINEPIPWTSDVTYATQVQVWLKRAARQDILDSFMAKTYKTPNDYRTIVLSELRKGVMRTIEDALIYGTGATEATTGFPGLNALVAPSGGGTFVAGMEYDMGGSSTPLSMAVLRQAVDAVKPKPTFLLMTRTMRNTLSAVAFEKGVVLSNANPIGKINYTPDQFGATVAYFDGVPIMISDYLGGSPQYGEVDNTGVKATSASGICSIYAIRAGQIEDGGLCLLVGGDSASGANLFQMTELPALEDYDAGGIRLVAYVGLAMGSTKAISHIHSIDEDGAIVA